MATLLTWRNHQLCPVRDRLGFLDDLVLFGIIHESLEMQDQARGQSLNVDLLSCIDVCSARDAPNAWHDFWLIDVAQSIRNSQNRRVLDIELKRLIRFQRDRIFLTRCMKHRSKLATKDTRHGRFTRFSLDWSTSWTGSKQATHIPYHVGLLLLPNLQPSIVAVGTGAHWPFNFPLLMITICNRLGNIRLDPVGGRRLYPRMQKQQFLMQGVQKEAQELFRIFLVSTLRASAKHPLNMR